MDNQEKLLLSISEYISNKLRELSSNQKPLTAEDMTKNFMDMGIDSVNLINLTQTIEDDVNIELYPTLFFEYQNVDELSQYFATEHAQAFSNYFKLN